MLMHPSLGTLKRGGGQNLAVCDDDQHVDSSGGNSASDLGRLEARGLLHWQARVRAHGA